MTAALLHAMALVALVWFAVHALAWTALTLVAWIEIWRQARMYSPIPIDDAQASPLTPPISVIVPAHDEESGIVESVRSLLSVRYPQIEVVVVDDGSTDATLDRLRDAFDLVPVHRCTRGQLASAPRRGTYQSRTTPGLVVVSKENGGKADALNCGIDTARYPFVCAVDADSILEQDALLRVARPILDDPRAVVATGGVVRIANGCAISGGRVTGVALPASRLAMVQVGEYLRAFLIGRIGWSCIGALPVISGAFGVFRRSVVEAVGGYDSTTVGEDMELIVRIHRHLRSRGEPYRIAFVPDPVCWTEVPERVGDLARQRRRWQRGLAQTLARHRVMVANPAYGALGVVVLPYLVLFELLGPVVELAGVPVVAVAFAFGAVSGPLLGAALLLAIAMNVVLSMAAVALEELGFHRYERTRDVARILLWSFLEALVLRPVFAWWRLRGLVDALRRRPGWGSMTRRGLAGLAER